MNHFAGGQKLTQHYKSATLQFKKRKDWWHTHSVTCTRETFPGAARLSRMVFISSPKLRDHGSMCCVRPAGSEEAGGGCNCSRPLE